MNNLVRTLIFIFLFGVGVGALGLASLLDDIHTYYQQRHLLAEAEVNIETLRALNTNYDALLDQIENDPGARRRLAPVVLGRRPEEPNAVFPEAAVTVMMQAKQAVASHQAPPPLPEPPAWLIRLQEPRRRQSLFISGGALVLIAILWFGLERKREAGRVAG